MARFAVNVHICGTVVVDAESAEEAKDALLGTFEDEYGVYKDSEVETLVNKAYANGATGEDNPLRKSRAWQFSELGFGVNTIGPAVALDKE